jgi:predicted polyphosphate/ATP-dependent NAD kinase
MYEEGSQIPFIPVPTGQDMPSLLFVFESRETGEFEPGLEGDESPVFDIDLHQYVNMRLLQDKLEPTALAAVRNALKLPEKTR